MQIDSRQLAAFAAVLRGEVENDDFNRLVLAAQLTWRQAMVLRAYAKYMRQAGFTFSQAYIEQTLAAYPVIARHLLELFLSRHDPAAEIGRDEQSARLEGEIAAALDGGTAVVKAQRLAAAWARERGGGRVVAA